MVNVKWTDTILTELNLKKMSECKVNSLYTEIFLNWSFYKCEHPYRVTIWQ